MRRLLIISFSTIETDPRVRRQLALLKDKFELVVAGFGRLQMAGVSMVTLPEDGRSSFVHKAAKAIQLLSGPFTFHY